MIAKALILAAAAIFATLGVLHAGITLWGRGLMPGDARVFGLMQASHLRLDRSINLWEAWIGFNLSHSLALLLFGGGLGWLALWHYPMLTRSLAVQTVAVGFAAIYLGLSLRYWFRIPSMCLGIALTCLVAGFALQFLALANRA